MSEFVLLFRSTDTGATWSKVGQPLLTLDPAEGLSPGQADEITRVHRTHPELNDDAFVTENLARWLSG